MLIYESYVNIRDKEETDSKSKMAREWTTTGKEQE